MEFFSDPESRKEHVIDQARMLREEAKLLPPGPVRDAAIRAARQTDIAAYLKKWVGSSGLQPPT